ncbi:Retrovirus-related Env polyprotein from transposon gypsy [Eumeta japonica]|uniref:Retrovirus-related Env polyprotein from transposon gypsy n=1 Tax=Eumeta variegata TaxID=151549 RepID=A0A4C1SG73_EUMVA|nr:Retrovirus-related Env polyprotein from transposon gypsy [Eumeta japonica]
MYFKFLLVAFNLIAFVNSLQIYQYKTSLVSLKVGNGWIVDGNFKLIHVINLEEYQEMASNISSLILKTVPPSKNKEFILHHMSQMRERLDELTNVKRRSQRSINWIGSAWKWVAGNPDATDWNSILKSQENIIVNNNEQYKINKELQRTTNQAVRKINEIISRINNITSGKDYTLLEQTTINEVIILKDEINEIVRAFCKRGSIAKLEEDDCISRILKGGSARCKYKLTQEEIVELLSDDVIYLTNFKGLIEFNGKTEYLNGSYLLQLSNESVSIRNHSYSSSSTTKIQALPPVLANVTHDELLLDIKYVHEVSLNNINRLNQLGTRFDSTIGVNIIVIAVIILCVAWLWFQQTKKLNLPKVHVQLSTSDSEICGTQTFKEGGVNTDGNTAA